MRCPTCRRDKGLHLFRKGAKVCKSCMAKDRKAARAAEDEETWIKRKAAQLRGSWRDRAGPGVEIASGPQIAAFLRESRPWVCVYTGEPLDRETIGLDHAFALAGGGGYGLDNIVICHRDMNACKGALDFDQFMDILCVIRDWPDRGVSFLRRLRYSGGMFKHTKRGM